MPEVPATITSTTGDVKGNGLAGFVPHAVGVLRLYLEFEGPRGRRGNQLDAAAKVGFVPQLRPPKDAPAINQLGGDNSQLVAGDGERQLMDAGRHGDFPAHLQVDVIGEPILGLGI